MFTVPQIKGNESKETLVNIITDIEAQFPLELKTIPAVAAIPAIPAVVDNGITTTPEKPAVPAVPEKSVHAQILEFPTVKAYYESVKLVNEQNAKITLENTPIIAENLKIKQANEAGNIRIAEITKQITSLVIADEFDGTNENYLALKNELKTVKATLGSLKELALLTPLPTLTENTLISFTRDNYPVITTVAGYVHFFGITKVKVEKATTTTTDTTTTDKTGFSALTTAQKNELHKLFVSAIESGMSNANAVKHVGIEHPIYLTAPSSTYNNVLHQVKYQGEKANSNPLPITLANYELFLAK